MAKFDKIVRLQAENNQAVYHDKDLRLASILRKSIKNAEKSLLKDYLDLLGKYTAEGGFKSRAEAEAFLNRPISQLERIRLLQLANRIPEPQRTQMTTRLKADFQARLNYKKAMQRVLSINSVELEKAISTSTAPIITSVIRDGVGLQSFTISKGLGVGMSFSMPPTRMITAITRKVSRTSGLSASPNFMMSAGYKATLDGLLRGDTIQAIASTIMKADLPTLVETPSGQTVADFNRITHATDVQAKRLARTITTSAAAEGEKEAIQQAGIKQYRSVATLDERTCDICGDLDGKVFDTDSGAGLPPYHPNCRCVIVSAIPSILREELTRTAKVSGKDVELSGNMDYPEYKKKFLTK